MAYRSSERGNPAIPANIAILGYRLVPGMPIEDALKVYYESLELNEFVAAVRRHPSWTPTPANEAKYQGDPEWSTDELRFALKVFIRTYRVFGDHDGLTHLRNDGRFEVADHADASHLYCEVDDWCILEVGHPGDCHGDREMWFGANTLYIKEGVLA